MAGVTLGLQQSLQQNRVNATAKSDFTVDGHHGDVLAVRGLQVRIAVHIDRFDGKTVALAELFKALVGIVAQVAALPRVDHEMQAARLGFPWRLAAKIEEHSVSFAGFPVRPGE
jgi:hypothetical protein